MTTMHISVAGKIATFQKRDGSIVCGNDDYRVTFTFDEEWSGYERKIARFIWGGRYYDQPIAGNEAPVPDIDSATEVLVGLYVDDEEITARTTTSARIPCLPSVLSGGELPRPEDGESFSNEAKQAAREAAASAASAAQDAAETAQHATEATEAASRAQASDFSAGVSASAAEAARDAAEAAAAELVDAPKREEIDRLCKRVTNLEKGITPDPFHVDDGVAYVKDVPANALPFAQLDAVGGMVHKETPELPIDAAYLGDLWAQDTDPQRETSATIVAMFPGAEVGKTYSLAYDASPSNGSLSPSGQFTLTEDEVLGISAGGTDAPEYTSFTNVRLIGEGVLRETKVTALEIVGKNLFNEKAVTGGVNGSGSDLSYKLDTIEQTGEFIRIKVGGSQDSLYMTPNKMLFAKGQRVAVSADVFVPSTVTDNRVSILLAIVSQGTPATNVVGVSQKPTMDTWVRVTGTITIPIDGFYSLRLQPAGLGNDNNFRVKNITVTTDETVTEHTPYRKTTLTIPAEVQSLDGYGWGIPNGAHNGIEWDDEGKAVYVKRVERRVYNGTEEWRGGMSNLFYVSCYETHTGAKYNATGVSNRMAWRSPEPSVYTSNQTHRMMSAKPFPLATSGDTAALTAEWKAQLAEWHAEGDPLTVYYELETPEVTDISHLITRDNFIPVEGGGIIIAQNENADAAPSTVVYQLKPEA